MTRLEQALTFANTQDGFAKVWAMLGLPDEPKRIMHSPFRPDSKPSFSVYERGGKPVCHDFATGESFDALDLVQHVLNVPKSEASRWLINAFCPSKDRPVILPCEILCPDRAFANQLLGAFECFRRARRNGRDPLPEVIGYWNGETQPVTQKDLEHESSYGDLSRVFPFLKQRNAKPINDESQP